MIVIDKMNLPVFVSFILVYVNAFIIYTLGYILASYSCFIIYFCVTFQVQLMLLIDNICRIGEGVKGTNHIDNEQYQSQVYYDICRTSQHHNKLVKLVYHLK